MGSTPLPFLRHAEGAAGRAAGGLYNRPFPPPSKPQRLAGLQVQPYCPGPTGHFLLRSSKGELG